MDQQVLAIQRWLNATYSSYDGWVFLLEDGVTGWQTIYGLRRGLQHELGISPMASGFGSQTVAAFNKKLGAITAESDTPANVLTILSGSLWCKGFSGVVGSVGATFSKMASSIARVRENLGLGDTSVSVDVKLMAFLLSMDTCTVSSSGSEAVREVQQWLNAKYLRRRDFSLVPCDGLTSRQMLTAFLYALQYEIGMADGTANGNFGPGTRAGIKSKAAISLGSVDSSANYVHLFSGLLRYNGYLQIAFDGFFTSAKMSTAKEFQRFMGLEPSGAGDYQTWCSLLVSCGDTDRVVSGFDTSTQLATAEAAAVVKAGYSYIGRYLVGTSKRITAEELLGLKAAGLRLFPIMQRFNNSASTMTHEAGLEQGLDAIERAHALDLPSASTLFFAVDFDPGQSEIEGCVTRYFQGVNEAVSAAFGYKVGVYGTRNVCRVIASKGLASASFVAGMSWAWSGNMGYKMPDNWGYNQIAGDKIALPSRSVEIDKVAVRSSAPSVSLEEVRRAPTAVGPYADDAGFDLLYSFAVRAELEAARTDSSLSAEQVCRLALNWARKARYTGMMWDTYLTEEQVFSSVVSSFEAKMSSWGYANKIRQPGSECVDRDSAHFSATAFGCIKWRGGSLDRSADKCRIADLGGWALDLLQLWGVYCRTMPLGDMETWVSDCVGAYGDPAFDRTDLMGDADAVVLASLVPQGGEVVFSEAIRQLLGMDVAARLGKFYELRFASTESNVVGSFQSLVKWDDSNPIVSLLSEQVLLEAANADRLPDEYEAAFFARGFVSALKRIIAEGK